MGLLGIFFLSLCTLIVVASAVRFVVAALSQRSLEALAQQEYARQVALLKGYEAELRNLEIKARTRGYAQGDQDRYAELIAMRNNLKELLAPKVERGLMAQG